MVFHYIININVSKFPLRSMIHDMYIYTVLIDFLIELAEFLLKPLHLYEEA